VFKGDIHGFIKEENPRRKKHNVGCLKIGFRPGIPESWQGGHARVMARDDIGPP